MNLIQDLILLTFMFSSMAGIMVYSVFNREKDLSAKYWTLACASYCLGLILVALRPYLPGFIAYAATNFFLLYPLPLFVYSFRAFANQPVRQTGLYELLVTGYALGLYIMFLNGYKSYGTLVAAIVWIFANLWMYFELRQLREAFDTKFARLFKSLVLLSAFAWAVRMVAILSEGLDDLTISTQSNWASFLLIYILTFAHQFLYLIIRLTDERSQRHRIEELNRSLHENLYQKMLIQKKFESLEGGLLSVLNSLAMERDNETGNHIVRTQNYVKILATRLFALGKLGDDDSLIDVMQRAAPLHDIGKIGIPDQILLKPGRLDPKEWEIMKTHASIGENVLASASREHQIDSTLIRVASEIAGGHHENWDGTGYPRGAVGENIPISARIMAVADTYDALVSERVYKKEWTHDQAVQEIIRQRGTKFDPDVIDAFLLEANQFDLIAQKYKDN